MALNNNNRPLECRDPIRSAGKTSCFSNNTSWTPGFLFQFPVSQLITLQREIGILRSTPYIGFHYAVFNCLDASLGVTQGM